MQIVRYRRSWRRKQTFLIEMAVLAELIDITLDKDNAHNDNIPIIDETVRPNTLENCCFSRCFFQFSIGRDLKCSHVLLGVGISRHHCLIERKDGKWLLLDTVSPRFGKELLSTLPLSNRA